MKSSYKIHIENFLCGFFRIRHLFAAQSEGCAAIFLPDDRAQVRNVSEIFPDCFVHIRDNKRLQMGGNKYI